MATETRTEAQQVAPDPGLALCLSGGGLRATLFHLGALKRLNELGVLLKIGVFVSVSGGSILNGVLATRWRRLRSNEHGVLENFDKEVGAPIREFCSRDLRTKLLFWWRANPLHWPRLVLDGGSVTANQLAEEYESLFERQRLVDLPTPGSTKWLVDVSAPGDSIPRFVFCATSVQTGACWQFHSGRDARMGEFYEGYCDAGSTRVSDAVAASSAFPPGFAGLRLHVPTRAEWSRLDPWQLVRGESSKRPGKREAGSRTIILTDGGVYDNLGLEPIWNRCRSLLVSDAGRPFSSKALVRQAIVPRLQRAAEISAEQVGAVRKRWLIEQMTETKLRKGALWSINTRIEDFKLPDAQGYGNPIRKLLPEIRTDLNAFTDGEVWCLQNHGYSLADAAMRTYGKEFCVHPNAPFAWPDKNWINPAKVQSALAGSGTRTVIRDILGPLIGF